MSFLLERGQTVVCLGDSITQASDGYVSVLASLITARYPDRAIRVINAGIGGNKAPDMLARMESDVLIHRPDWVMVNVGINDVWHGLTDSAAGVPLARYEPIVEEIVSRIQAAGAQAVLVTPTVIGEETGGIPNQILAGYVAAMEQIGVRWATRVAPAHADFLLTLRAGQATTPEFRLTTDGVHLNAVGNARMALTILETLEF